MITLTEAAVCTGWCLSAPGWRRVLFLLPSPRQSCPAHLRNQLSSEKALYFMYPSGCGVSFLGLKSALRHWLESNYQSGLFPLTSLDLSRCWLHSLAEKALVRLLSIIIMASLQRAMIPWSSFKEESWDGSLDGDEMIPGGTGRRLRGGRGGVRVRDPLSHQTRLTTTCSFGIVVFFGWVIGWFVICVSSTGFVRRIAIIIVNSKLWCSYLPL